MTDIERTSDQTVHVPWTHFDVEQVIEPGPHTVEVDVGEENPLVLQHDDEDIVEDAKTKIEARRHLAPGPFAAIGAIAAPLLGRLGIGAAAGGAGAGAGGGGTLAALMKGAMNPKSLIPFAAGRAMGQMPGVPGGQPGGQSQPQGQMVQPLPDEYKSKVAEYEHPSTVPSLTENDGDPHQLDYGEFNAQGYDPSVNSLGGTDAYIDPDSDEGQRLLLNLPILLDYVFSDKDGSEDPIIRGLHETFEERHPGYLETEPSEEDLQAIEEVGRAWEEMQNQHEPQAEEPSAVGEPPRQANLPGQQIGPHPVENRNCPHCGSTLTSGEATCPQCGAAVGNAVPAGPNPPQFTGYASQKLAQDPMMMGPGGPPPGMIGPEMGAPMPTPPPTTSEEEGHQGPHTAEQFAAVAKLLQKEGREDEIPAMIESPWEYAQELQRVKNQPIAPPKDLTEPEPVEENSPEETMPVPGMASQQMQSAVKRYSADNVANRCPKCDSFSTGLIGEEGESYCHSCGNHFKTDIVKEKALSSWHLAERPNVEDAPAADRVEQRDITKEEDTSHIWKDTSDVPLKVGREYNMFSTNYDIPDIIRITRVKPDSIEYEIQGAYNLHHEVEVTREEALMDGLTFEPIGIEEEPKEEPEADVSKWEDRDVPNGPVESSVKTAASVVATVSTRVGWHGGLQWGLENIVKFAGGLGELLVEGQPIGTPEEDNHIGKEWARRFVQSGGRDRIYPDQVTVEHPIPMIAALARWVIETGSPLVVDKFDQWMQAGGPKSGQPSPIPPEYMPHESRAANSIYEHAEVPEGMTLKEYGLQGEPSECANCGRRITKLPGEEYPDLCGRCAMIEDFPSLEKEMMPEEDRPFPRKKRLRERLLGSKEAGAKFSPVEQREFIDEQGMARNSDKLDLAGTHYETEVDDHFLFGL